MLDYPALAAVGAIIREGSFERAAGVLGITSSAISQRVRGLEERLGTILIIRGQPCEPTDLGRTLCAHLDRVQLLEADVASALASTSIGTTPPLALKIAVNADSLATWFPAAAAAFNRATDLSLDLTLDDEAHTAERLRSGEVLAAVTADPEPIQGYKTISLGALRYAACASPEFMARHFGRGVNGEALSTVPHLRFDRRDMLQARWASQAHGTSLGGPPHWIPSTQAFIDLALAGVAWGLQPLSLARAHIAKGRLIELPPRLRIDVKLYWTVARLHATSLRRLTDAVRAAAAADLEK
jgi:LysR family transcriptional regulator (chromosome initiation inhibitor)